MKNIIDNLEQVLDCQISGFHQYVFTEPVHISYASRNLCEMVGAERKELEGDDTDFYASFVHPADREKYRDFIKQLKTGEQTHTGEYRLVKRDGTVLSVRDTVTVKKNADGVLVGSSVLTDVTDLTKENTDLKFLNETIPCGFLKYTCEKQPRITYINPTMVELLRFPEARDGEIDYQELYKSNIFLMIPMEERRRFSKYLNRVYSADAPIAGEMTLLCCDGTRAHVFGWVTKCINEQGEAEFQSVCMDVTERYKSRKAKETLRYLKALTDVYDKVFEFHLDRNTVKCLYCEEESSFRQVKDLAVQIEDALEKWILDLVIPEHQERVRGFFGDFCRKRLFEADGKPPQISYKAYSSDGSVNQYTGLFIKVDDAVSFYCCRKIQNDPDTEALRNENDQLKEGMRDLVMRFYDGIAAFEVSAEGLVKPLYASENVCEFFGYTKEEWLPLTKCFTPVDNFVAYGETAYEEFENLLKNGEAEFTYFDYKTETEKRMKAICSQREPNSKSSRYVMLYPVEDTEPKENVSLPENRTVFIRTFGYFDVFVGDKPIAFRNKKSKELMALLVDRKGGFVTSEEAISFLWEDEPSNTVTLSRYRKVALRLKNTLEEYGIADVMESVDGKRRIVMEKVQCDLYQYLSNEEEYAGLFMGSYLTNYSWGETTLGELISNQK